MPADETPRRYVVLLVDDDLRTTRRMADMLRDDGFEVEIARDGAAAIARLTQSPMPDALVSELNTAHADGAAVCRFARSQRPGLPIFVVTGYPNLFESTAFGCPPAVLFTKPVEYLNLKQALIETLNGAAAAASLHPAEIDAPIAPAELESSAGDARRNTVSGAQTVRALRRP